MNFHDVFHAHKGYFSTKWEQYLTIYDRVLSPKINEGKPITLLEIGVFHGGSLEIWGEYLPKGSQIIGVDINPQCKNIEFKENINVIIGNATDPVFIQQNLAPLKYDIIIDDGSHLCSDVIATFNLLFNMLNDSGVYIIEDVHTSYWPSYGGGSGRAGSHMEYFKKIADTLNVDHIPELQENSPGNSVSSEIRKQMQYFSRRIFSIGFYDSVIVIEKHPAIRDCPFPMVNTGAKAEEAEVLCCPMEMRRRDVPS